jgi:predicted nucleic acid-binding protein
MIVVDASVIVTALADDGFDGEKSRRRLSGEELLAPNLIDIETVSAWRRLTLAGRLAEPRAMQAVGDLQQMRIRRVAHQPLLERCWELRENLSTYDAAYVALAELAGLVLVTADRRLANAPGLTCPVEILA